MTDKEAPLDPETRYPIHRVLPDMQIHPLLEGEVAEDVFVLIKTRGADGNTSWCYRTSKAPNREELLGALTVQVALLRRELLADWIDDEEDATDD